MAYARRRRRRRARTIARRGGVAGSIWFVALLFLSILAIRLVQIWDVVQHDSCESALFWLDGWERGRSLFQVTGGLIAGLVGLWGVWLLGRGALVPKLAAAVVLLALLAALDRQAAVYFPDRPHPLAAAADRLLPVESGLRFSRGRPVPPHPFRVVERVGDPALENAMRRDPLGGWAADRMIGEPIIAADGVTVTRYYEVGRRQWFVGPNAPTHSQMTAIRACVRYNAALAARRAAHLAQEPRAREGYDYRREDERPVDILPPLVSPRR